MKIRFRNRLSVLTLEGSISHVLVLKSNIYLLIPFNLSNRTLKPYIRRDYESRPLKLRLLEEIRSKCSTPEIRNCSTKPIDYCYVQPHHIPAVNAICKEFFWAGIDGKAYLTLLIFGNFTNLTFIMFSYGMLGISGFQLYCPLWAYHYWIRFYGT